MTGEVMVLTGCASGIGLHLTGVLAARGHRILATDVDEATLARRAKERGWALLDDGRQGDAARDAAEGRVLLSGLDVRSAAGWEAALDLATSTWGRVDVVMNIAGVLRPGYVHEITPADIDLHLGVNVSGTMLGTSAAARRMIERRAGHIVNFGSLASLAAVPGLPLYCASKFAVRGFSVAAAAELRPYGVAVTVVMPDAVQTPMLDLQVGYEQAALTFSGGHALTVDDIAALVVDRVLPERPMEIALPPSRAALARLANTAPQIAQLLTPLLARKGRRRQARIKSEKGGAT